jgi:outer membrane protein
MNKFRIFLIASALIFSSGVAMAQKAGYVSIDQVIAIMPDAARIDSAMQKYQADSINGEYVGLFEQYKYYDSLLTKTDTTKMPVSLRRKYNEDRENVAYQVQNWQQIAQNMYQAKQNQLLEPVYRRVMTAINTVAKEKGYTYVYDKSVFIVAPPGDDLLPAVAAKLNVKLPAGVQGGLR